MEKYNYTSILSNLTKDQIITLYVNMTACRTYTKGSKHVIDLPGYETFVFDNYMAMYTFIRRNIKSIINDMPPDILKEALSSTMAEGA